MVSGTSNTQVNGPGEGEDNTMGSRASRAYRIRYTCSSLLLLVQGEGGDGGAAVVVRPAQPQCDAPSGGAYLLRSLWGLWPLGGTGGEQHCSRKLVQAVVGEGVARAHLRGDMQHVGGIVGGRMRGG